jgi:hypothetical protein
LRGKEDIKISRSKMVSAIMIAGSIFVAAPLSLQAQSAPPATPPATLQATLQATGQSAQIPEGTEFRLQFDERLSSATNRQGDTFTVSLVSPVTLTDGTVIPAGFKGRGEVTAAEKRGMMGRAGDLSIRLEYIRIGATRVALRASRTSEGQAAMGSTIVLTVLFGPLGLLKRGKDIDIPRGQAISAFVDAPISIPLPIGAPPTSE